ncbi:hypothetical protein ACFE04_008834 [Oxalis oulophora]
MATMPMELLVHCCHAPKLPSPALLSTLNLTVSNAIIRRTPKRKISQENIFPYLSTSSLRTRSWTAAANTEGGGRWLALPPLDLTEENIKQVLVDARDELGQIFDTEAGMTGKVELAELDGPFVKISLRGRFWHERSMVLARVGNYLKQRIPEILEVDIEDEKQLDDSPANF